MEVCKICSSASNKTFDCEVLRKYIVNYYKCTSCGFIQTENPHWLDEAYSSAITSLDIGLIQRNILAVPILETLIKTQYRKDKKFVDYGGGYGMLVRMMRDKGYDYYRQDVYCDNIFSKNFDVDIDLKQKSGFELLSAFEVFEHLVHPLKEIELMLTYSTDIFFSTILYPEGVDLKKWWYLIPETGQHVSLYTAKSLNFIAKKYSLYYYNYNDCYHLFSKKKISDLEFKGLFNKWFQELISRLKPNPVSRLGDDFNKISGIKM